MPKYRVYLNEIISGSAVIEAETEEAAKEKALHDPSVDADWYQESQFFVVNIELLESEE